MESLRVLVVDDEVEFVSTLVERLQLRAIAAEGVTRGGDALAALEHSEFDVILLDVRMPGIGGLEVIRKIKRDHQETQVIMLTGHGSEKHEVEARKLGAFEYLQKPVDIETLMKKVKLAYKNKFERSMVAATFAEAGEFDIAKDILKEDEEKNNKK